MDLILCEKPSQGAAFTELLGLTKKGGYSEGKGYIVTWGFGHLYESAEPQVYDAKYKNWNLDDLPILPASMRLIPTESKKAQIKIIKTLIKRARRILIGTDYDREGEAIAWEVIEDAGFKGEILRLKYISLSPRELQHALQNPLPAHDGAGRLAAQRARWQADWLWGMNFSRLFSLLERKHNPTSKVKFSIGRVQTPTLYIAALREKAIQQFKAATYYHVGVKASTPAGEVVLKLDLGEFSNEHGGVDSLGDIEALAEALMERPGIVSQFSDSIANQNPPLPYIPSTLFKDAEKFGISTNATKDAYQKLYESKLITYPRSDNPHLPLDMFSLVPEIFAHLGASEQFHAIMPLCDMTRKNRAWRDVDAEDAAHHGIVPTEIPVTKPLEGDVATVYQLIALRFLQQFAEPRKLAKREVTIELDGGLVLRGSCTKEVHPGYRALAASALDEEHEQSEDAMDIPLLSEGMKVIVQSVFPIEKKTTKPKRFSPADLIDELGRASKYVSNQEYLAVLKENGGIGTEGTRESIVDGEIRKGKLVVKAGKIHVPNEVLDFLARLPQEIVWPDTTALWELLLTEIEARRLDSCSMDDEIKGQIKQLVGRYR